MRRERETILFLLLALGGGWLCGLALVRFRDVRGLSQVMMCAPAAAGLLIQWIGRREPPRAMGFAYTGWKPWAFALFYPLAVFAGCVALAYLTQAFVGRELIRFEPEQVSRPVFGHTYTGMAIFPMRFVRQLLLALPWLATALAYRFGLPEKLGRGALLLRAALWAQVVWFYPGPLGLPGVVGEELGWRGFLVRRWADRPLVGWALMFVAWPLFHLPILALEPALHAPLAAAAFLLSIAAAAAAFQAVYLWSGSVWPPVVMHFCWNWWNPLILGDLYGGDAPALFNGAKWFINGEGVLGMVINGAFTAVLVWRWRVRKEKPVGALAGAV